MPDDKNFKCFDESKDDVWQNFPTINSHERMGVTMSCSMVPRSRSRTMVVAVRMVVMKYKDHADHARDH
jgi:hypothetical protein